MTTLVMTTLVLQRVCLAGGTLGLVLFVYFTHRQWLSAARVAVCLNHQARERIDAATAGAESVAVGIAVYLQAEARAWLSMIPTRLQPLYLRRAEAIIAAREAQP